MDLKKIFGKDGTMINELAGADDIRSARAILKVVESERDAKRRLNEAKPMICDEDITRDWRYIAGMIAAFNLVLSLPQKAREITEKLPQSGDPKITL